MTQQMKFAPAVAGPGRVGQATAIEQSRAAAEVQAMVVLARQFPRDEELARQKMLEACSHIELAEKAFYTYKRGQTVTGMTIDAAVALAAAWGNLLYGLSELRRDDVYGQSDMQAYCWELEGNTRHSQIFIVPHLRSGAGQDRLMDPRDIYENNTNSGNRRMREAILKALPPWFKIEAEKVLRETLRKSVEKEELGKVVERSLAWYAKDFGVTREQLEYKLGKPVKQWVADDIIELRTLGRSLNRRELTLEDAFPSAKVTAEELAAGGEEPEAQTSLEASAVGAETPDLESDFRKQIEAAPSVGAVYAAFENVEQAYKAGQLTIVALEVLRADAQGRKFVLEREQLQEAAQPSAEPLPLEVGARVEILRPPADQREITSATMYKGCVGTVTQPDTSGPQDWFVRLDEVPEQFPAWRGQELPFLTSELRVIPGAAKAEN